MEQISDNALMTRVGEGDLDKLGLLYERYKKRLFGFFYNMTYDQAKSEDLVQNTFMRVIKYRKSYKSDREFKVWLFQIARNIAYDNFKKTPKADEDIGRWDETLVDNTMNQEESFTHSEEILLLNRAILRLDEAKREVLTLSKIDGLKYKEISGILGCTEGTVKAKVFRALKALKYEYEQLQSNV